MANTSIRKTLLSLTLGLSSAAAMGCVSNDDGYLGDDFCAGDCEPGPPISGNAIIDCWVTPAGSTGADARLDVLDCRYEPPANYPATLAGASIHGLSNAGGEFTAEIDEDRAGQVIRMAGIDPAAYPIEISMNIRFDGSDRSVPALAGLEHVSTKVVVMGAEQIAADRPASAYIPFDLWEVNLLGRDTDFSALSFGYAVDTGAGEIHNVAYKSRPLLFGRQEHFYLPVNVGTFAVDAKLVFESGDASNVSFTGPGDYSVRSGQMQRAQSADFPQANSNGSDLANCWFETNAANNEELYCKAEQDGGLKVDGAFITVDTVNGKTDRAAISAAPTFVATVSPAGFPLKITMEAPVQTGIVGLESLQEGLIRASMDVEAASLPREASAQTLFSPFEVWQATIENQTEGFEGSLNEYVLELGDGMGDRFAALVDDAALPSVDARTARSFLVATPAGQLEMKGTGSMLVDGQAQEIDFVLRPGTMIVGE